MKKVLLLFIVASLQVFIAVSPVLAYDPYAGVDCGSYGAKDKPAVCSVNSNDPITGTGGIIIKVADIVAFAAGAAAIILLLVSAIRFTTSGGDPAKVKKSRDTILYSLVGIIVIVLARSIIVYIVKQV